MGLIEKLKKLFVKRQPEAPVYIVDDGLGIEGSDGEGEAAADNDSGLIGFRYSYNGSIGGNSYSVTVKRNEGGFVFEYDAMEHSDMGELSLGLSSGFVSELDRICRKHRITRWNGFSKYAKHVCDGDGFSLYANYADGKSVSASGNNAYPSGFGAFEKEINVLFSPVIEEVLEAGRKRIIEGGIRGNIESYMINFEGKGAAGNNKYCFFVTQSGIRDKNVDIRIES
ncbi:MAG: hypothetical protein MJ137_09575, partial [Clostridia bacterium]|nr:hypothetical protein [Clostridia bacterium]